MPTPTGFTAFIAANIQDASNTPLVLGSLLVQPTDDKNLPITARSGGAGGQMIVSAATFPIVAGAIPGSAVLADVQLTSPINISYRITILDAQSRTLAVHKGVQPTGASFNFDTYNPNVPAQAPYTLGPAGPTGTNGTNGTNGAPGANGIASLPQLATLRAASILIPNLVPPTGWSSGFIQISNGNPQAAGDCISTPFLPANAGGMMTSSLTQPNQYNIGGAFYDTNQTYISGIAGVTAGVPFAVPANAAFLRLSFQLGINANPPGTLMLVNGSALPSSYTAGAVYSTTQVDAVSAVASAAATSASAAIIFASNSPQLPLSYAQQSGVLPAPIVVGASNIGGTPVVTGSVFSAAPLTPGSVLETITLNLQSPGTTTALLVHFIDAPWAGHNNQVDAVTDADFVLDTANAVLVSAGIYKWTAGIGFPTGIVVPAAANGAYFGVSTYGGSAGALSGFLNTSATGTGYYLWGGGGTYPGVGQQTGLSMLDTRVGELDMLVTTRAVASVPTTTAMNTAIAAALATITSVGSVPESRPLRVEFNKGGNVAAGGGTLNIFNAAGPGNVERIQLAMIWPNGATPWNAFAQNMTITITVDGGAPQTCSLGMFMLWHGYNLADNANSVGDLFATKYIGVVNGSPYADVTGYRRIYIKYNTSCVITLTNPDAAITVNNYSQVDYYPGVAPVGRFPATRNVFHMVANELSTSTIGEGATLNVLPAIAGAGELESLYFASIGSPASQTAWLEDSPSVIGDGVTYQYGGCEDFFGNQFYGSQFHGRADEHGIARFYNAGGPDSMTHWSAYRYFKESPFIFASTLSMDWVNAGYNGATQVGTLAVYYTTT